MKKVLSIIVLTVCNSTLTVFAETLDESVLLGFHQITADIEMEVVTRKAEQSKEGSGQMSQSQSKSISTETVTNQDEAVGSTRTVTNQYKADGSNEEEIFSVFDFSGDSSSTSKSKTEQDKKQKFEETGKTAVSPKPEVTKMERSSLTQMSKKVVEQRLGAELEITKFSLNILHDSTIPKEKLDLVRKIILSLYLQVVRNQNDITIVFIPAAFAKKERKWW